MPPLTTVAPLLVELLLDELELLAMLELVDELELRDVLGLVEELVPVAPALLDELLPRPEDVLALDVLLVIDTLVSLEDVGVPKLLLWPDAAVPTLEPPLPPPAPRGAVHTPEVTLVAAMPG